MTRDCASVRSGRHHSVDASPVMAPPTMAIDWPRQRKERLPIVPTASQVHPWVAVGYDQMRFGIETALLERVRAFQAAGFQYLTFIVFDPETLQLLGEHV